MKDEAIVRYTTASGKTRFKFSIYIGKDSKKGSSIQIRKGGFKSLKEAKEAYLNIQLQLVNGQYRKDTKSKIRFVDLYEKWLKVYKPTVKESTFATTMRIVEGHVLKDLGNYYLDKIRVVECQQAVEKWFKESPKTYKRYIRYASRIFKYGVHLELIKKNPMEKVIRPKLIEKPKEFENFYSKEELDTFLFWCRIKDFRQYAFFRLLAYTGLRKGEACALTWSDIDFKEHTIRVEKTTTLGMHNRIMVSTPKTKSSYRTIEVDNKTLSILLELKKKQRNNIISIFGNPLASSNFVFSINGVSIPRSSTFSSFNSKLCAKKKIRRISLHGFRHTHASLLFEAGVSMQDVKERLGHKNISMTMNIYTHVTKKRKKETALKFANYMEK
ncbi:tyrosine-type recombinase/integrase [Lactobacillus mulieris]|uniref:tyrosine-type recombinase/integrase n=1 Tax=Lactobacillus mulieris TaxID=2508708 RepID=UPI0022AC363D|nr:tyrosine-type recombinase/integrase [Lactobacillus mulieris]MCZ3742196.1 site-specific integrase [Lactobacillus mulieris]MCZ3749034.1 site-specific integrase [Lactobacillus mulieris]MCZ3750663.1 site-specific integrase [Lactobacillus mulieris]MDT9629392.1 tyrosine-type recombinase/integrase [Lactobacillus mulieris]